MQPSICLNKAQMVIFHRFANKAVMIKYRSFSMRNSLEGPQPARISTVCTDRRLSVARFDSGSSGLQLDPFGRCRGYPTRRAVHEGCFPSLSPSRPYRLKFAGPPGDSATELFKPQHASRIPRRQPHRRPERSPSKPPQVFDGPVHRQHAPRQRSIRQAHAILHLDRKIPQHIVPIRHTRRRHSIRHQNRPLLALHLQPQPDHRRMPHACRRRSPPHKHRPGQVSFR